MVAAEPDVGRATMITPHLCRVRRRRAPGGHAASGITTAGRSGSPPSATGRAPWPTEPEDRGPRRQRGSEPEARAGRARLGRERDHERRDAGRKPGRRPRSTSTPQTGTTSPQPGPDTSHQGPGKQTPDLPPDRYDTSTKTEMSGWAPRLYGWPRAQKISGEAVDCRAAVRHRFPPPWGGTPPCRVTCTVDSAGSRA